MHYVYQKRTKTSIESVPHITEHRCIGSDRKSEPTILFDSSVMEIDTPHWSQLIWIGGNVHGLVKWATCFRISKICMSYFCWVPLVLLDPVSLNRHHIVLLSPHSFSSTSPKSHTSTITTSYMTLNADDQPFRVAADANRRVLSRTRRPHQRKPSFRKGNRGARFAPLSKGPAWDAGDSIGLDKWPAPFGAHRCEP
jgi:hypothetical protein